MKKHKLEVTERICADGVMLFATSGEAVSVNDEPMVRLHHGTIVADRGYSDTLAEAKQAAARDIELLAHKLLGQADKLRAEAARLEVADAATV